ncbi:MAG: hypothetical protein KKD29_01670 [Candidatus Omnitrophica bacterium]|nr:hypothetical protein [Candidatus Omnitrophota bacterium]MBU4488178.1 hypothetical protein [Candidatus Omnitrophota bacterium]MCG2704612.1 hypothetical protein [Candidatus Omnitrophota bacterium]
MKDKERKLARALRSDGWSLRAIAAQTKCSKGSVSKWISDIHLTDEQIERLKSNQDKGRAKAAKHPRSSKQKWANIRNGIIASSQKEISSKYSNKILKIVGAALYWAEGYNASRNAIVFANTDPRMIKLIMLFFREICKVPEGKFRGKIFIHPHLNVKEAEKYWSNVSGISLAQFNKPLLAISKSSLGKRDTLPFGTFSVMIGDVYVCSRIKGWIQGMSKWADSSVG